MNPNINHISIEPIHFTLWDISRMCDLYQRYIPLIKIHLNELKDQEDLFRYCILIDDINCKRDCQKQEYCEKPCMTKEEIITYLNSIDIKPNLILYESELKHLSIKILNEFNDKFLKYDGNYIKLIASKRYKIRLAYDHTKNKEFDFSNIDKIEPTCVLYTLAWYYYRSIIELPVKDEIYVKYPNGTSIEVEPYNQLINILPGKYHGNESSAEFIVKFSDNEYIKILYENNIILKGYG